MVGGCCLGGFLLLLRDDVGPGSSPGKHLFWCPCNKSRLGVRASLPLQPQTDYAMVQSEASGVRPEIKYKKLQSECKLYQECGFLYSSLMRTMKMQPSYHDDQGPCDVDDMRLEVDEQLLPAT